MYADDGVTSADHYQTTTNRDFAAKELAGKYQGTRYGKVEVGTSTKMAVIEEKVNRTSTSRRPLSMGSQTSEMRAQYQGVPADVGARDDARARANLVTTMNKNMPVGRQTDAGVIMRANRGWTDYSTTSHASHRPFSAEEKAKDSRSDQMTFWQSQNYPKTRGFGVAKSEKLPLKEKFKSDTVSGQQHQQQEQQPHGHPRAHVQPISTSGKSLYRTNYDDPTYNSQMPSNVTVPPLEAFIKP